MIRILTPRYTSIRETYHTPIRPLYGRDLDDQESELLESDFLLYKEMENGRYGLRTTHSAHPSRTTWVDYWDKWKHLSQQFETKFQLLQEMHHKHSTFQIGKSEATMKAEIEDIQQGTSDLKQLLQNMNLFIQRISRESKEEESDSMICRSISKRCTADYMEFLTKFQGEQESYLKRMDSVKQLRNEVSIMMIEDDLEELRTMDEMMDRMLDHGFTSEQMELIIQNRRDVLRRDKELSEIVESIASLQELFSHLNHLVHEQGTLLDRIDYNLERTHHHVRAANDNLVKADRYDKTGRGLLYIILLVAAIIVIFSIIGIKILSMFY